MRDTRTNSAQYFVHVYCWNDS